MPSAANISLNDATPAAHTFIPLVAGPALTIHSESGVAVTAPGSLQFTSSLDVANAKRSTDRLKFQFSYPVEQTTDGVTTVAYTARAFIDVAIPVQMTNTERGHLAAYVQNLMANSVIKGYYTRQPMY